MMTKQSIGPMRVAAKSNGSTEVFLGRHVRGKGVLAEEVQGEFCLQEELFPQEFGEGIRDARKDGKEVEFESADGAFGYVGAMDIRRDKLESAVPIFNDGVTIIGAGLVVEDLEINSVAFGLEGRNYYVVGSNAMAVVA